jgi:aryl-alcohol dehydrogenase-like predicted oxidoreductase
LGRTGLTVSALSLGTVSLALDYGIPAPGAFERPTVDEAIRIIQGALDRGITLIDTAPAYGDAEHIVGLAAGRDPRAIIATKVALPAGSYVASTFNRTVDSSLESSLRALKRDVIDILQIHNATCEMIAEGAITHMLVEVKQRGLVRVLGASVYDSDAALAAIRSGEYGVLQVVFNALDQRMMHEVIPAAAAAGVGVVVRSALLKGALTPKARWLPASLAALRESAARARDALAGGSWERLPEAALRFCLTAPHVASVLAGARTLAELEASLAAEAAGPLDADTMVVAASLAMNDDALLNPSRWPSIP